MLFIPQVSTRTAVEISEAPSDIWNEDNTNVHVEIDVIGESRVVLTGLARLASEFNTEAERRISLGHDCAVFALAWESGETFKDTLFKRTGGSVWVSHIEHPSEAEHIDETDIEAGEIIFTSSARPTDNNLVDADPHFLVRATVDDKEPLYLSKLGRRGPVVLSTLQTNLEFYQAKTIARAHGLFSMPQSRDKKNNFAISRSATQTVCCQRDL